MALADVHWDAHRIIQSRFPPINLFESIIDVSELDEAAKAQRIDGANGLLYNGVRRANSEYVAVFKPIALSVVTQSKHFIYYYKQTSQTIEQVMEIREVNL